MDMNELRKQIDARKQEAKDKKIGEKAEFIAKNLGTYSGDSRRFGAIPTWLYKNDGLTVTMAFPDPRDERHIDTAVGYGGWVFSEERGKVRAYVPGPWEKIFEGIYSQARDAVSKLHEASQTDRDRQEATELAKEARRFGL